MFTLGDAHDRRRSCMLGFTSSRYMSDGLNSDHGTARDARSCQESSVRFVDPKWMTGPSLIGFQSACVLLIRYSHVWVHTTICFPTRARSRWSLTNGQCLFPCNLMVLSNIVVSCKILRDATPRSLVILDGRSSRHFLLTFTAHPNDKNLEEGRPPLYVFPPFLCHLRC